MELKSSFLLILLLGFLRHTTSMVINFILIVFFCNWHGCQAFYMCILCHFCSIFWRDGGLPACACCSCWFKTKQEKKFGWFRTSIRSAAFSFLRFYIELELLSLFRLLLCTLCWYRWSNGCRSGGFNDYTATTFFVKRSSRKSNVRIFCFV